MSNEEVVISQAVKLAGEKLAEMNRETNVYLRNILKEEAKRIYKDLKITDSKIIAEKLNDLVIRMNQVFQKKKIQSDQPLIDWFYINSYATYYQDNDPQKIVVNVINDDSSEINPPKSDYIKKIPDKPTYKSSNAIIGSRTIEDLFQVIKNQRSTSPINERVIIIDNYNGNSSEQPQSIPPKISTSYIPQQPVYYNTQFFYTSLPSYIYVTTATTNSYPFTYFRY